MSLGYKVHQSHAFQYTHESDMRTKPRNVGVGKALQAWRIATIHIWEWQACLGKHTTSRDEKSKVHVLKAPTQGKANKQCKYPNGMESRCANPREKGE